GKVLIDRYEVLHMAHLAGQHDCIGREPELFGTASVADGRDHQCVAHDGLGIPGLRPLAVVVHHARHELVIETAPIYAYAHRLVVAASDFYHLREVVIALFAPAHIAGIDAVFGER